MEQLIELESRHESGIYALKILGVGGSNIIVKNPLNPKTCVRVPVSYTDYYGIDIYVDVAFANDGDPFRVNLIGITEPQFVPNDGEEIF